MLKPRLLHLASTLALIGSLSTPSAYAVDDLPNDDSASETDEQPQPPRRFALISDSLGTGLFGETQINAFPRVRPDLYERIRGMVNVLYNFKWIAHMKWPMPGHVIPGAWQDYNDMNQIFGPYTNPYQSLYHHAVRKLGNGSSVVTETAIIASKVEPAIFGRHIHNFTHWQVRDFDSIIFAMGSNDICRSWQNADQFEANYRSALRTINSTFPGRKLYVISPADPSQLNRSEITEERVFAADGVSCRDYFMGIVCPSFADQWRAQEFTKRVAKVAAEFPNAKFVPMQDIQVQKSDLSNDCFHPNFAGHRRFGEILSQRLR